MRPSKASAGESPNLPPHRGLLSLSLTMVQFNLLERRYRELAPTYSFACCRPVFWYCLTAAFMVERPSVACLVRLPIMSLPMESTSSS